LLNRQIDNRYNRFRPRHKKGTSANECPAYQVIRGVILYSPGNAQNAVKVKRGNQCKNFPILIEFRLHSSSISKKLKN